MRHVNDYADPFEELTNAGQKAYIDDQHELNSVINPDNNGEIPKILTLRPNPLEVVPECGDKHPYCCSFKKPDQWDRKQIHEHYDCLSPEELRRTGKECDDLGEKRPNQEAWNKRWECCADRKEEEHMIGDKFIKTWVGVKCEVYQPGTSNAKPIPIKGVNEHRPNSCPSRLTSPQGSRQ